MIRIEVHYDANEYRAEAVAEEFVTIIELALEQYEEVEKLPDCTIRTVSSPAEKPSL